MFGFGVWFAFGLCLVVRRGTPPPKVVVWIILRLVFGNRIIVWYCLFDLVLFRLCDSSTETPSSGLVSGLGLNIGVKFVFINRTF